MPAAALEAAVDGCGVVTFAASLDRMALSFARLMAAAEREPAGPAGRVVGAMTSQPYYVGGSGRLSTRIMETTRGRVLAKYGAEAVMCLGVRERRWGLAVKVEDGERRGIGPAVIEFLGQLGLLDAAELQALDDEHVAAVTNTRDEVVGEIRPTFHVQGQGRGQGRGRS
jgi:L-asparaginase II